MASENKPKRSKRKALLIFVLVILLLGTAATILMMLFFKQEKKITAIIPDDVLMVLSVDDPMGVWQELEASPVWAGLSTTPAVSEIQKGFDEVKQQIGSERNRKLLHMLFNRQIAVILPTARPGNLDFVFAADIGIKIKLVEAVSGIKSTIFPESRTISYSKRTVEGVDIQLIKLHAQKQTLGYAFLHNILLFGNNDQAIEKCILAWKKKHPVLNDNENFLQVQANVAANTRVQLFVNGKQVHSLLQTTLTNEAMNNTGFLLGLIQYTGFGLKLDKNCVILKGFSSIAKETAQSELQRLLSQTPQKSNLVDYIPGESASFSLFTFNDFDAIWQFTRARLQTDPKAWNDFETSQKLAQKYLGVELERDLLSWIGQEIGTMNLPPDEFTKKPEAVLLLGVKDRSTARQSLDQIKNSVSSSVPINFKEKNYKGVLLSYMDLPFFLKIFFGGLFNKVTKPYWGIVGDYVLFSDNIETLEYLIDAHISKSSLKFNPDYVEINDIVPGPANASFYFDTGRLLTTIRPHLAREAVRTLNQVSPYLERLKAIGITLTNKYGGLEEMICISVREKETPRVRLQWNLATSAGITAPVTAAQLDDEDGLEIIAATENGQVLVIHADSRPLAGWPKSIYGKVEAAPACGDLDVDGRNDLVVAGDKNIYVWHSNGQPFNNWPVTLDGKIISAPTLADLDNDSDLEIIIGCWDKGVYAFHHTGQAAMGWPQFTTGFVSGSPAVGDIDGDDSLEVVAAAIDGRIFLWNHDGSVHKNWPVFINAPITASPVLADMNSNGRLEVIIAAMNGKCYIFDARGDSLRGWPQDAGFILSATPALANVDGKSGPEVIVGAENRKVFAWKENGELLEGWPQSTRGKIKASAVVADIDDDGKMEIMVAADDGKLYCWDEKGKMLAGWPKRGATSPVLADFDGDGDIDLAVGSWDRNLYFWDLVGKYEMKKVEWAEFQADPAHRGVYLQK